MANVTYSHGVLIGPYNPPSFQQSLVLYYPYVVAASPTHYGRPTMPKAPYRQPWTTPHSNWQARGENIRINIKTIIGLKII